MSRSDAGFAHGNKPKMSHRFKPPKPLDNRKKNMKSGGAELPRLLPMALESAGTSLYDFLYVDRPRISALYAQLFPQGILTSVKTTSHQGFSDDQNFGSDIKIIKAEAKSSETGSEGIEHTF